MRVNSAVLLHIFILTLLLGEGKTDSLRSDEIFKISKTHFIYSLFTALPQV